MAKHGPLPLTEPSAPPSTLTPAAQASSTDYRSRELRGTRNTDRPRQQYAGEGVGIQARASDDISAPKTSDDRERGSPRRARSFLPQSSQRRSAESSKFRRNLAIEYMDESESGAVPADHQSQTNLDIERCDAVWPTLNYREPATRMFPPATRPP